MQVSFIGLLFENVPSPLRVVIRVFIFALVLSFFDIFLVNYFETKRHCCRKTTSRLNELLLGDLRTNRERVILPSSRSKIKKKNTLFIDQSAQSVILPAMLLDRVKSTSVMRAPTAVKALMETVFDVVNGDIELMAANEMTLKRSNS